MNEWWTLTGEYNIGDILVREYLWPKDRLICLNKIPSGMAISITDRVEDYVTYEGMITVPTFDITLMDKSEKELVREVIRCSDGDISHVAVFKIEEKGNFRGIVSLNTDYEFVTDYA